MDNMLMGKRKRKNNTVEYEDFGSVEFHCSSCGHDFEIPWIDIFDLQASTLGYVGFHINDVYISCPECGSFIDSED